MCTRSPHDAPSIFRLDTAGLRASVTDPTLTSMTLLNDIAGRYPQAVSFAAGRPYEGSTTPARCAVNCASSRESAFPSASSPQNR